MSAKKTQQLQHYNSFDGYITSNNIRSWIIAKTVDYGVGLLSLSRRYNYNQNKKIK